MSIADALVIDSTFTAPGTSGPVLFATQALNRVLFTIRVTATTIAPLAGASFVKLFGSNYGGVEPLFVSGLTLPLSDASVIDTMSPAVTGLPAYNATNGIVLATIVAGPVERNYALAPTIPWPKNIFFQVGYGSGGGASVRIQVFVSGWT